MAATTITTNHTGLAINNHGLLQLLQLTSPSLPIGGFAWSQGLEYAIDAEWLKNESDTLDWLRGLIRNSLANLDIPVLCRLHGAATAASMDSLAEWNAFVLASRETSELYLEDTQMGAALRRLLLDLGFHATQDFPKGDVSYLTSFAMAAVSKGVDSQSACIGFMWSWLENQIAASLKAFPLGQTAGQRLFHGLADDVIAAVEQGQTVDDLSIGNSMPGQIMASMLHEDQYSRLFRS